MKYQVMLLEVIQHTFTIHIPQQKVQEVATFLHKTAKFINVPLKGICIAPSIPRYRSINFVWLRPMPVSTSVTTKFVSMQC